MHVHSSKEKGRISDSVAINDNFTFAIYTRQNR